MVPILSYYCLQNLDFPLNVRSSNPVFSIGLDRLHLQNVQFKGDKLFEVIPDRENEIHIKFNNVDVNAQMEGSLDFFTHETTTYDMSLEGLDVDVIMHVPAMQDNRHWKLKEITSLSYDKFTVKSNNYNIQQLIQFGEYSVKFVFSQLSYLAKLAPKSLF